MTKPVEVFPPGDFIREELMAREWTQSDLATIMGRPVETVNRIIKGKLAITPETACGLASAFGTSAELWLNLESAYQLSRVRDASDTVARRARLYSIAPVAEMVKREWIQASSSIDVMEPQLVRFFDLSSIDDEPVIRVAARKATDYSSVSPTERAWYFFVKNAATEISRCRPAMSSAVAERGGAFFATAFAAFGSTASAAGFGADLAFTLFFRFVTF